MPDHPPGPTPPYPGPAGAAANQPPGRQQPSQSPQPSGAWSLPASLAPAWQAASEPMIVGPPAYLPAVLIASGLFSLLVAGTGLIVVTRLRRQW
ncbi:hypothetical protein [Rugosimonospora africana]|uniref:Uncharacterized protein n=1 Tax=Rugosimonospora africana TaxID=556532 RepID=A0A8J3VPC9_9ACTN|nr:hypothetical protein [Rugosimonospora africana]GIH13256.1 hypothetical protein Raf01_14280 [Rugosimonospora africana]